MFKGVPPMKRQKVIVRRLFEVGFEQLISELEAESDANVCIERAFRTFARCDFPELVCIMLTEKKYDAYLLRKRSYDGVNDALLDAAKEGNLEIVQILLNDERSKPHSNYHSVLFHATKGGHIEVTICLVSDERIDLSTDSGRFAIGKLIRETKQGNMIAQQGLEKMHTAGRFSGYVAELVSKCLKK